jgi:hypothetical protein
VNTTTAIVGNAAAPAHLLLSTATSQIVFLVMTTTVATTIAMSAVTADALRLTAWVPEQSIVTSQTSPSLQHHSSTPYPIL